jgi:hypothetical protein
MTNQNLKELIAIARESNPNLKEKDIEKIVFEKCNLKDTPNQIKDELLFEIAKLQLH